MFRPRYSLSLILIFTVLSLGISACNHSEPTPESDEVTIDCGAQELVTEMKNPRRPAAKT